MVKEVIVYAKYDILQSFLKRRCRSSAAEDLNRGSWMPVRTRTAVRLPALLQKHRCHLIKELIQRS